MLLAMGLPNDLPNNSADKYIKCLQDGATKEKFKADKYKPVIKSIFAGLEEE